MPSYVATVTSKGQISLPADLRRKLGIVPNSRVTLSVEDGQAILRPVAMTLEDVIGTIPALPTEREGPIDELRSEAWDEVVEDRIRRMRAE